MAPRTPEEWIRIYLEEDVGPGDATSEALLGTKDQGRAVVVARQRCFVAGLRYGSEVFRQAGAAAHEACPDGWVDPGQVLLVVEGPARAILAGERTSLNLLARMAGVATATRGLVERLAAASSAATIAATRKTTPGFRFFEKEAVRIAGGEPYREGLWDVAMVKDNHREAAGGVAAAVARVRAARPELEVVAEVECLEDALAAAASGAHWVMVDNQGPEVGKAWAQRLWLEHPSVRIEASGGIRPEDVEAYGWADRISLGWLTTAVPVPDLGLDWSPPEESQS